MPEWHDYVRQHLPELACPPESEAEIVEEIALQLEGVYRTARSSGASDAEARERVADEVSDWPALAAAVIAAKYPRTAAVRSAAHTRAAPLAGRRRSCAFALTALRDLRHAARSLAASPVFTVAATMTLALGVGATTAVFSLVNAVLLEPLPFRDPSRLAIVQETIPELAERYPVLGANPRSFTAWTRGCTTTCESLAALGVATTTLTGGGEPEGLVGARVSANFFDVLGMPLAAGRPFTKEEDRPGADAVVVLGHALWVRRFGADRSLVGRAIELDGQAVQVVGVLSPSVDFPRLEHLSAVRFAAGVPEFFRPLAWPADLLRSAGEYDNVAIARLAPGATPARLQAELDALTESEFRDAPVHPRTRVRLLADHWLRSSRRPLSLLLASVVAALVIACVNVANLMGGRWVARRRELAIRTAMGASFGHLLRLVASESALIAAAGGASGLLFAFAGLQGLVHLAPAGIPRLESVRLDTTTFAFGLAATLFCGIVCALLPVWHALRSEAADALKAGAHSTTDSRRWGIVRGWLVGAEVALTSALLIVGGLLLASFQNVLRVPPGFHTARVLAVDLKLPRARYADAEKRTQFFATLLPAVQAVSGVEAAGIVRVLPLEGEATVDVVAPAGDPRPLTEHPVANHLQVSPGYFRALGLTLVSGRWLTDDDRGRQVALVSQRTARAVWPNQNPLGRRFIRSARNREWEVIGVVADSRLQGLEREPGLVTYVPYWGGTASDFSLAVRTYAEPAGVLSGVRDAVARLDRQLPLQRVRTMEGVLETTLANRRFQVRLMIAFGGAGLLLACLGVYSVVTAAVERRTPEFAVRLALGATPRTIARTVLGHGLRHVAAGVVVGVIAGMSGAAAVASLLFGVTPYDPRVTAGVVALMLTIAAAACLTPAMRATRTDPIGALRRV